MTNRLNAITQVRMKDGSMMNHIKDNSDRHVFFGNLVAMNKWMMAILIFILLTSILMNYFTATLVTESNNIIMTKLHSMDGAYNLQNTDQGITFIESTNPND